MAAASFSSTKSLQNGVKLNPLLTNQTEPPQYSFSASAFLLILTSVHSPHCVTCVCASVWHTVQCAVG